MDFSEALAGKVAIVTGAGRGIGRAIAVGYASAGASVCCAARTVSEIETTLATVQAQGGRGVAIPTDVTDRDAVRRMVEATVDAFGGLDILVINAGLSVDHRSVEQSVPEDWQRTLDVNLTGAYHCAQAVIPHLKARGAGKIITVGSGMGHRGSPHSAAYSCSKAGLWMLTRILAQELWQHNISVNELIPGPVVTSMIRPEDSRRGAAWQVESEWVKDPEEVVPLALFLAAQPDIGPTAQSYSLMRREG